MNSLQIKSISKNYKGRNVIKDITMQVSPNEVVGLLGPNGAGKTTSFFIIAGLMAPDSGNIYIDGEDVTYLPIHLRASIGLGYLPQESSIFLGLTVAQNIMSVLEFIEKNVTERENRLAHLLAEFSLTHIKNVEGAVLSGGERRRTEIARCLAANPRYILLDEPFAGVDPIAVEEIKEIIQKLRNKGIGILITDHNVQETLKIIDRCYVIYGGEVLAHGIPAEISANPRVRSLYLGKSFHTI